MPDLGVASPAGVNITVSTVARHLCPFVDEDDHGHVEISWTTTRHTLELHELGRLINGRARERISHEQWTADLAEAISERSEVANLTVQSRWQTAGIEVVVRAYGSAGSTPLFTDKGVSS